jgi:cytochrome o ubiquinol oxidase operon protein cyoD
MSERSVMSRSLPERDVGPGLDLEDQEGLDKGIQSYAIGLVLALALTGASFWAVQTHWIYGPGVPVALVAFAVAQMGVHIVFFLHITTGPDNTNNLLALAFGILIICLLIFGSLWIMANLSHNMMPMKDIPNMQR